MAKAISLENLSRFKQNYDTYVAGLIASAIAGVYKPKGSKTVAQLNALTGQVVGDVYNVTDSGTLTAGNVHVVAGDNVVWVSENSGQWDKLAGTIDLSGYLPKSAGSGNALTGDLYTSANIVRPAGTLEISASVSSIALIYGLTTQGQSQRGVIIGASTNNGVKIYAENTSNATHAVKIPYSSTEQTLAYRSDISSANIIAALGYTPYSNSNPAGYITGITSTMVTNALGYTPYNSTNPAGYITGITATMINTALGADALTQASFATNSDIDGLFS